MSNPSREENQYRSPFQGFLPFFWFALAYLGGILLADLVHAPGWIWLAGMAVSILALMLAWRLPISLVLTYHLRKSTRFDQRLPGALLVAVFFLGAWRYADLRPEITPRHAAYYNDRG